MKNEWQPLPMFFIFYFISPLNTVLGRFFAGGGGRRYRAHRRRQLLFQGEAGERGDHRARGDGRDGQAAPDAVEQARLVAGRRAGARATWSFVCVCVYVCVYVCVFSSLGCVRPAHSSPIL